MIRAQEVETSIILFIHSGAGNTGEIGEADDTGGAGNTCDAGDTCEIGDSKGRTVESREVDVSFSCVVKTQKRW